MSDSEERMHRRADRHGKRRKAPVEAIITGLVFIGAFGALWYMNGPRFWWCIFPMAFAGLLPLLDGLRRLFAEKRAARVDPELTETRQEKQILQAAHDQKGRLTAAGAALRSNLSLREASRVLERMTKQGHAVMNVTSSGTIEYEFPDFLPDEERRQLT